MWRRNLPFGVVLRGCSGTETIACSRRSTADRIREAVRLYKADIERNAKSRTLLALADRVWADPDTPVAEVVSNFAMKRRAKS